jgi:DNA ligase-1
MTADPDSFLAFSEALERVRGTGSKNEKASILGGYFATLNPTSLAAVARFMIGKEVSQGDIGVGWRVVMDALGDVVAYKGEDLSKGYLKYGDLGSIVEELFAGGSRASSLAAEPLTVARVSKTFNDMAATKGGGSSSAKKKLLLGLLMDARPVEAKYIVRIITNELRVGATAGLVEEGLSKAFSVEAEIVRNAFLVTGDIGEVAGLLARGKVGDARPSLYRPVAFMLAEPKPTAAQIAEHFSKEVVTEVKYDGVRLQAHVGKEVRLFSRRMEDVTESFPEIVDSLAGLGREAILDGEALGFDGVRPIPFVKMQARLHRKEISGEMRKEAPVYYFVFDLLYLDGTPLLERGLAERRRLLEGLQLVGRVRLAPQRKASTAGEIGDLFRESRDTGFEGLMVKDPLSPYTPGRRGGLWVKLKEELDTIDAVVVAAEYGNGKRAGLLSDYTFAVWDGPELKVIGKAYSGLTDEEILMMTDRMKELAVRWEGHRCVVQPKVVLEITFDSIQESGRHDSGYALRFPRIKDIRLDKAPEQADTLDKVKAIYEGQRIK